MSYTDFNKDLKQALYLPPGLFFVLPCTDNFVKVDLRTVSFDIPPQEVGHSSATEKCSSSTAAAASRSHLSPGRSWPRTRWRWQWTASCTSGYTAPSRLWPTCPTRTRPRGCWLKPPWGMRWAPKTWQSCCLTERGYHSACRWGGSYDRQTDRQIQ